MAVAARFAAAPGIKPWQAGALLLRRSMSTPLTGIADQLERQQQLKEQGSLAGEPGGPARDGGPSACEPGGPGSDGQWSQEVLAEARMRLVAGEAAVPPAVAIEHTVTSAAALLGMPPIERSQDPHEHKQHARNPASECVMPAWQRP
jgi:hypothetical protein